jgi:hypothetical protein
MREEIWRGNIHLMKTGVKLDAEELRPPIFLKNKNAGICFRAVRKFASFYRLASLIKKKRGSTDRGLFSPL